MAGPFFFVVYEHTRNGDESSATMIPNMQFPICTVDHFGLSGSGVMAGVPMNCPRQPMICPICLEQGDRPSWPWPCNHTACLLCVRQFFRAHPPCPVCRGSWGCSTDDEFVEYCAVYGVNSVPEIWGQPHSRAQIAAAHRHPRPPLDVIPLCCPRRGPPPDFLPQDDDRRMP